MGGGNISASRRILRAAGSVWVGAALLGAILIYLAVVSVFTGAAARALGTTPDGVYGHWIPVALGVAMCVSLAVATVTRIPFRPERLGAWCSHAGVMVLAAGSAWYVLAGVRGDCVSVAGQDGAWSRIDHFYLKDSFAAYAGPGGGRLRATPIANIDRRVTRGIQVLDVPLAGCGPDVSARATGYMPSAAWRYHWLDDSPNEVPAVMLAIGAPPHETQVVLSPSLPGFEQAVAGGFVMVYRPNTTPETLKRLAKSGPGPGIPHDLALVLTGRRIPPTILVISPDAKRWRAELKSGIAVEVPLAGRKVPVRLVRIFTNAARRCRARPVDPGAGERDVRPVLRVQVQAGAYRTTTFVPFAAFEQVNPPQLVDLPGGRALWLNFSRVRRPLPAALRITRAQYLTYPACVVPKDYVCDVRISGRGPARTETIRLNEPAMVGPYQISQGTWDRPGRPSAIMFLVATRPGLPVIWLGCALICVGFPYAFYIRPLLARRKRR